MLERKVVSVLFADLVGSTALAGELDPEELRDLMGRYRDAVGAEIRAYGGTMEKFIGDAPMAVFGAPQAHEDDPERAVRAAFAIRDVVLNLENGKLNVRIGVYTGEVVADPTAAERGEFMVTGEAVNLAQRLQAAAAPGEIVVSARTWRNTRAVVDYESLPPLTLSLDKRVARVLTHSASASLSAGEFSKLQREATISRLGQSSVDGVRSEGYQYWVTFSDSSGQQMQNIRERLFVSLERNLPLRTEVLGVGDNRTGTVDYSAFNSPTSITLPSCQV